jgi:hypothetical protein
MTSRSHKLKSLVQFSLFAGCCTELTVPSCDLGFSDVTSPSGQGYKKVQQIKTDEERRGRTDEGNPYVQ